MFRGLSWRVRRPVHRRSRCTANNPESHGNRAVTGEFISCYRRSLIPLSPVCVDRLGRFAIAQADQLPKVRLRGLRQFFLGMAPLGRMGSTCGPGWNRTLGCPEFTEGDLFNKDATIPDWLSGEHLSLSAIAVSASRCALVLIAVFFRQPHRTFAELGGMRRYDLILLCLFHNGQSFKSFALWESRGGSRQVVGGL